MDIFRVFVYKGFRVLYASQLSELFQWEKSAHYTRVNTVSD